MKPENISDADFVYNKPSIESYKEFENFIFATVRNFKIKLKIVDNVININRPILYHIRSRLDQRQDYYKYFHSSENKTTYISQTKETAIICYWLIKYKPISYFNEVSERYYEKYDCTINEMFALYLLETYIYRVHKNKNSVSIFFNQENKRILLYNFMHRDLSKEAFIMYISSLIGALEL